ncbi:MAG: hypothetical protein ACOX3F_01215 [Kiritimatiellia bacterium]|jgi:predicted  nucleic acid-binding Zn-ribbon protein
MMTSTFCGLAIVSGAIPEGPSADMQPPRKGSRLKRTLRLLIILFLLLCAIISAVYWQIIHLSRRQLITQLIDVARDMEVQKEYAASRELYLRATKVNTKSLDKTTAMESVEKIQHDADRQAAERAVIERKIAEIRGMLADLEIRKRGLEGEKAQLDREVQALDSAKAKLDNQIILLQENIRKMASQFKQLTASVGGLTTQKDQLTTTIRVLDDTRAKLQASVDRIQWITDFPEAMLKYHETIFKPAVRQLGDASLRLSVVVRAVDLGLKTDDYIGALIAKEMEIGGCVREAQAVIEQGRILVAQGNMSPEVGKLLRSQQANLERIVNTLVEQCSRFNQKEIRRGALKSWLGSMPDDLNHIIKIERKLYESAAPAGWPSDDIPLVKEVRGTMNSATIVKYLDMLDRKETWESNVEVAYLAANPSPSIRALVPGTVVISLQDSPVRNAEEAISKIEEVEDNTPVTVKYIEARAWAKGIMVPQIIVATKEELTAISWRTSYKKVK